MPIQRTDKSWTGDRVLKLRKALSLSQEAFAHEVGCSVKTVVRWESGTSSPSVAGAVELARLAAKPGIRGRIYRLMKVQRDTALSKAASRKPAAAVVAG